MESGIVVTSPEGAKRWPFSEALLLVHGPGAICSPLKTYNRDKTNTEIDIETESGTKTVTLFSLLYVILIILHFYMYLTLIYQTNFPTQKKYKMYYLKSSLFDLDLGSRHMFVSANTILGYNFSIIDWNGSICRIISVHNILSVQRILKCFFLNNVIKKV